MKRINLIPNGFLNKCDRYSTHAHRYGVHTTVNPPLPLVYNFFDSPTDYAFFRFLPHVQPQLARTKLSVVAPCRCDDSRTRQLLTHFVKLLLLSPKWSQPTRLNYGPGVSVKLRAPFGSS